MIQFYKELIITDRIIEETNDQICYLIETKSLDGSYFIIEKYYKQIFESLFEALLKTNNNISRDIGLSTLSKWLDLIKTTNLSKSKEFQIFLVNEILKFSQNFSKVELSQNFLKNFNYFMYYYVWNQIYCQNETSNSYLLKPILQLTIVFLQMKTNDLSHVAYLLSADRLFNLTNYSSECILILNELARLFHSKQTIQSLNETNSHFIERVKVFRNLIENLQPVLFDKILCESIENQIYDGNLANLITHLLDLTAYPKEKAEIKRLTNVISIISKDDVFDSFQADMCSLNKEPANFYYNFFVKLAKAFQVRPQLVVESEENLDKLLDKIKSKNEYYSLFLDSVK